MSEKFKVFTLSIPGFDAWKGQKGRIKSAIDEGLLMAKDYWGGGGGEKDFKNLSGNIWKQRNFDGEGAELVGCLRE